MKIIFRLLLLSMLIVSEGVMAQQASIFTKGEVSKTDNHLGTVWLKELNKADSIIDCSIATATFASGARLYWHIHPA